jgi:hypothetical protein
LWQPLLAETSKQEVDHLSERLQQLQAVQIMSASGSTVYAEGQFQDGFYDSDSVKLWVINLTKQLASCPLGLIFDQCTDLFCMSGEFARPTLTEQQDCHKPRLNN